MSLEYSGFKWIEKRAISRLEELHLSLEAPGLDIDDTNLYRGQIQEVRRCIEDAERAFQASPDIDRWEIETHG